MGLDFIELVLAVEETFGIDLPDDEAGEVGTVGDLEALVLSKLGRASSDRCLTSAAFYRVRRAMVDVLWCSRAEIRPSTVLAYVLPESDRRAKWEALREAMTLQLPDLKHSRSVVSMLLAVGVAGAVVAGSLVDAGTAVMTGWVLLGFGAGALLLHATPSLALKFPGDSVTVGDLSRTVLAVNYAQLSAELGGWNEHEVRRLVRELIVQQFGVAPEQLAHDARFVEDLRLD